MHEKNGSQQIESKSEEHLKSAEHNVKQIESAILTAQSYIQEINEQLVQNSDAKSWNRLIPITLKNKTGEDMKCSMAIAVTRSINASLKEVFSFGMCILQMPVDEERLTLFNTNPSNFNAKNSLGNDLAFRWWKMKHDSTLRVPVVTSLSTTNADYSRLNIGTGLLVHGEAFADMLAQQICKKNNEIFYEFQITDLSDGHWTSSIVQKNNQPGMPLAGYTNDTDFSTWKRLGFAL